MHKIDKNFEVKTEIEEELVFINCMERPIRIYGVSYEKDGFVRMPGRVAEKVSPEVGQLSTNTAGGRVRFRTNSSKIGIRIKMRGIDRAPHFSLSGMAGLDLYDGKIYRGTFMPHYDIATGFGGCIQLDGIKERELTIHLPLYAGVTELEIGICSGASLLPAKDYATEIPVVYYGSSITQGGCASRPGNCYENIISRQLDCNHINLGFSGNAKGEDEMADYIAGLEMSAFVYDYDHNAPDVEHLKRTHERMFRRIRKKNPDLPIIMVTRPKSLLSPDEYERRAVIMNTYQKAYLSGDQNVYFVDGSAIMNSFGGNDATVDGVHPTDLGFMCMAKSIGAVLENVLN